MSRRTAVLEPLITENDIRQRVAELGRQITADYRPILEASGEPLVIIGALKGVFLFMADLVREIDLPTEIYFFDMAALEAKSRLTVNPTFDRALSSSLRGHHVLLIEDIVDRGLSLSHVVRLLWYTEPASVQVCTLLSKTANRLIEADLKYIGFDIDTPFVVGYGLDYQERYRNLPYLAGFQVPKEA